MARIERTVGQTGQAPATSTGIVVKKEVDEVGDVRHSTT